VLREKGLKTRRQIQIGVVAFGGKVNNLVIGNVCSAEYIESAGERIFESRSISSEDMDSSVVFLSHMIIRDLKNETTKTMYNGNVIAGAFNILKLARISKNNLNESE